jgi:hydrogenase nickel incorporation protein HypB
MIFVENVGNLVCPADFDLGERGKVAVLSTAEGEDKPLKYPLLFREAMAIVLTKMDLLPLLDFSIESCMSNIRMLNPTAPVFTLSSASGAGLDAWIAWLLQQRCVASDPRRIP